MKQKPYKAQSVSSLSKLNQAKVMKILLTGEHTKQSIAEQAKVSKRTVERIINACDDTGFEVRVRDEGYNRYFRIYT